MIEDGAEGKVYVGNPAKPLLNKGRKLYFWGRNKFDFTRVLSAPKPDTMSFSLYTPEYQSNWDNFVSAAKNGVFLFYRDYMEYHSDRFQDHSLLFFNDGRLVGLFPAKFEAATCIVTLA